MVPLERRLYPLRRKGQILLHPAHYSTRAFTPELGSKSLER
jgi:hypothetical protein